MCPGGRRARDDLAAALRLQAEETDRIRAEAAAQVEAVRAETTAAVEQARQAAAER